ncbi:protein kinase domain-containing protein, partial [Coleofasciculus sp.]|uniref:protein kinase domain-containing protein n=1 Tax=Coleofasciculus sp. TaxID=3100458 RepID=UPI003A34021D
MEQPIASGTILQARYHLIRVLGQGGFGRTYLAEDLNRFKELCVLKELIPPQTEAYTLEKSKELFQREATTLYQIKHPQVPEFRATFEQDKRLFLAQDYVEGKTYRELLNQRLEQLAGNSTSSTEAVGIPTPPQNTPLGNPVFSEAEVKQLLQQLLPVLEHIHTKGIIHRDITPDNIILRQGDQLPVLIDFGVVKELATRLQSPDMATPATTVGKLGYAPSEQIQTGKSYPSSDLYSLAVTAVVLLTGKEPRELLDNTQLTWNWQRWVTVSDEFARILNRMLSYRPGDRYPSATDVLQALQSPPPPAASTPEPDANVSGMATVAVGRRPEPQTPPARTAAQSEPVIPEPSNDSIWEKPGMVVAIGAVLAVIAGLGSWAIANRLRQEPTPPETIVESPSPLPTETESPSPSPTPTEPRVYSRTLALSPGQDLSIERSLQPNTIVNYQIQAEQDQTLEAFIPTEGVYMTLIGPDDQPVSDRATRVQQWRGELPYTGEYTVQLSLIPGLPETEYQLNLDLTEAPQPTPSPTESPSPSPSPSPS